MGDEKWERKGERPYIEYEALTKAYRAYKHDAKPFLYAGIFCNLCEDR